MNVKNVRKQVQTFRMTVDAAHLVMGMILRKAGELAGEVDQILQAFDGPPPEEGEEPIRHPTSPCPPYSPDIHVNGDAKP